MRKRSYQISALQLCKGVPALADLQAQKQAGDLLRGVFGGDEPRKAPSLRPHRCHSETGSQPFRPGFFCFFCDLRSCRRFWAPERRLDLGCFSKISS